MTLEELMSPMYKLETGEQAEEFIAGLLKHASRFGLEDRDARAVVQATVIRELSLMPPDAPRFELEALLLPRLSAASPVQLTRTSRIQI